MPVDSLDYQNRSSYIHTPAHDLESLLQTVLGIVSFTDGPCGSVRPSSEHVPIARWYNDVDREQLFKDKCIDFLTYRREIEKYIPLYWSPLLPYLARLVKVTFRNDSGSLTNQATHRAYTEILEEALAALKAIKEPLASYAAITKKRPRSEDNADAGRYPLAYRKISRDEYPQESVHKSVEAHVVSFAEWQERSSSKLKDAANVKNVATTTR